MRKFCINLSHDKMSLYKESKINVLIIIVLILKFNWNIKHNAT